MKKKRLTWLILVFGLLTACQRSEKPMENTTMGQTEKTYESSNGNSTEPQSTEGMFPAYSEDKITRELSSGVIVDAEVELPEEADLESMPVYSASLLEIPFEDFRDALAGDRAVTSETELPSQDSTGNGIYIDSRLEDNSTLTSFGGVDLSYESARGSGLPTDPEEDSAGTVSDQDFAFETRESADQKLRELLHGLGVDVYADCECHSVDRGDFQYYQFRYYGCAGGMPVTDQIRIIKDIPIPAPCISAIYSPYGIERIEILDCFRIETEEYKTPVYTVEGILDVLDQKYNSIILEGDYTVTKLRLEYVPEETEKVDSYRLIPAWRMYLIEHRQMQRKTDPDKTEPFVIASQLLFRAEDGKELQYIRTGVVR